VCSEPFLRAVSYERFAPELAKGMDGPIKRLSSPVPLRSSYLARKAYFSSLYQDAETSSAELSSEQQMLFVLELRGQGLLMDTRPTFMHRSHPIQLESPLLSLLRSRQMSFLFSPDNFLESSS
jgi:hypothetical protein